MKLNLNKQDIEFLIDCLKSGKEIPEAFKYDLFPTMQKEYELVYAGKARKEDVLADKEEAKPVPLQIEKVFNGTNYPLFQKDWHNLLVFGDNLQILKTFYENKDAIIKNKIKGRIKLIYIDPPFGTGDEYDGANGQSAYSAKRKGADFVEFLRRRLILLREILADDGSIFLRMDYHFGAYAKVILDEVFEKSNFRNEIIVNRTKQGALNTQFETQKSMNVGTDSVYWYSKNPETRFKPFLKEAGKNAESYWHTFWKPGNRPNLRYNIYGVKPDRGQWLWEKGRGNEAINNYKEFLSQKDLSLEEYWRKTGEIKEFIKKEEHLNSYNSVKYWIPPREFVLANTDWTDIGGYSKTTGYPTENSEELLNRIIESSSEKSDLVLDVFAGSGTTAAVAEKLGRRWVACDIGKLSIYTIQKRLLKISESKGLKNPRKKYGKPAKSFAVVASGLYDLGKIFALEQEKYTRFVKDLFEIEETKRDKIGGVGIDGMKRGFPVKIFPYWEMKKTSVDEKYLEALHKNLGRKVGERFYIIAPANNVDFISDYHEINDTKYYFLKVPYQIIKELHKVPFKKLHQPQSKSQINDLEEAKGFHFVRPPEVEAKIKVSKDKIALTIKKFETAYTQDETGEKLKNFESLAMLLVDLNYDGDKFMMTHYFFAEDLLNHKKKDEAEESAEKIKKELKQKKEITREFPKKECGKQMMAIYVDIYGNEFREVFNLK